MFMQRVLVSAFFLMVMIYAIFDRDNFIAVVSGLFFILCYVVPLDHQED